MHVRSSEKEKDWKSLLKQLHTWLRYWKPSPRLYQHVYSGLTQQVLYWSRSEKAVLSLRLEHVDVGLNSTLDLGVGKTTPPIHQHVWYNNAIADLSVERNVHDLYFNFALVGYMFMHEQCLVSTHWTRGWLHRLSVLWLGMFYSNATIDASARYMSMHVKTSTMQQVCECGCSGKRYDCIACVHAWRDVSNPTAPWTWSFIVLKKHRSANLSPPWDKRSKWSWNDL